MFMIAEQTLQREQTKTRIVASIPTEDILVRSSIGYMPQYATDTFGHTKRATKDVTICKLLNNVGSEFPSFKLMSIGTPVNFDIAPTHLTRVQMKFEHREQVESCLKEISVSDLLIRSRVQPAWDWQIVAKDELDVILHVGWYDTVYFMKFKDIFLGEMHCRYSAKFDYNPREATITHFRYDDSGDLEIISELNESEKYADSVKDDVEFIRVFRDGSTEHT